MQKKLMFVFVISTMLMVGCSKNPDKVTATYVSPIVYESYSCDQVSLEMQRIASKVASVSGAQKSTATNDAVATTVGVVIFWPALFFLMSDDQAAELARLKGESDALQQVAIQKNCHQLIEQIEKEKKEFEEKDG